jgi:hypothetical protein
LGQYGAGRENMSMKISETITTDRFPTKDGKMKRNMLLLLVDGWFEKRKKIGNHSWEYKSAQKGFELKDLYFHSCAVNQQRPRLLWSSSKRPSSFHICQGERFSNMDCKRIHEMCFIKKSSSRK